MKKKTIRSQTIKRKNKTLRAEREKTKTKRGQSAQKTSCT